MVPDLKEFTTHLKRGTALRWYKPISKAWYGLTGLLWTHRGNSLCRKYLHWIVGSWSKSWDRILIQVGRWPNTVPGIKIYCVSSKQEDLHKQETWLGQTRITQTLRAGNIRDTSSLLTKTPHFFPVLSSPKWPCALRSLGPPQPQGVGAN